MPRNHRRDGRRTGGRGENHFALRIQQAHAVIPINLITFQPGLELCLSQNILRIIKVSLRQFCEGYIMAKRLGIIQPLLAPVGQLVDFEFCNDGKLILGLRAELLFKAAIRKVAA